MVNAIFIEVCGGGARAHTYADRRQYVATATCSRSCPNAVCFGHSSAKPTHVCTPTTACLGDDDVHSPHTRVRISVCLSACVCVRARMSICARYAAIRKNATIKRARWCSRNCAHNWCCSFAIRTIGVLVLSNFCSCTCDETRTQQLANFISTCCSILAYLWQ